MDSDGIVFLATISPLQSAIQINGSASGMRVKLDIPESEMGNALGLLAWRDKVLRVRVELGPREAWDLE